MDRNAATEPRAIRSPKPARVALNVLALCFTLSVLGRGLGESFSVFLKPISESFGWDRAQVVSVYSLSALAGGLAAPLIGLARAKDLVFSGRTIGMDEARDLGLLHRTAAAADARKPARVMPISRARCSA